ncbi:MAG: transcription antitermination factor NusB [Pseudomonadales bacterium]|nr:transcription antitermination factor NusB [Pseudomonadales bacterium]MDG1442422.1 transcription antitermination factor NusB [Pseudomonadales bacterium]
MAANKKVVNIKNSPAARSKARRFVLQALYQMHMTGTTAAEVETQFRQDHDMKRVDTEYLHDVLIGIAKQKSELIEQLTAQLDRAFEELDPVETAALKIGAFELIHRVDVPYRVVINEGVELVKQFGASESHKLVNTVLDSLAKVHRQAEYARR